MASTPDTQLNSWPSRWPKQREANTVARFTATTVTTASDCSAIATGALGELMVAHQLTKRGWTVCIPMVGGNSSHFDLVAAKGGQVHRVQVKASRRLCADTGAYVWGASKGSKGKTAYSQSDFDFIILVFVTEPILYLVMPVEVVSRVVTVKTKVNGKYWPFHERWDLLEHHHDETAGEC
jgi:hypothetical protein